MSASQYQRQLAINRIRQIELDTMNAIHRAKSIKEVQDALLNGIRKIMEVGLEGSFDSFPINNALLTTLINKTSV